MIFYDTRCEIFLSILANFFWFSEHIYIELAMISG
jgi:hypothetical protein